MDFTSLVTEEIGVLSRHLQTALNWTTVAAGVVVSALGGAGSALATPTLTIITPPPSPNNESHREVLGDAGGTSHAAVLPSTSGPGLPTRAGGWPETASFDTEAGIGRGMTGFHASYLSLNEPAEVTFQYMGSGSAREPNIFGLDFNDNGILDGPTEILFRSGVTEACSMQGGLVPVCTAGNQFTFSLGPGRIAFLFQTGQGVTFDNTGNGLGNPDTALGLFGGYFLGVDPYQAASQYETTGRAIYAGLTDLPTSGDHDFQDLGVRISAVPEPGTLALAGIGALGLLAANRRRKNATEPGLPPTAPAAA